MKLIESAQKSAETDRIKMVAYQLGRLLQFTNSDELAEDAIVARFMRGLDDRFVMLRNLQLEDNGGIFPPILVGPSGLVVLTVSRVRGFYKAKDDTWWEMDKSTHQYIAAHPNLLRQAKNYAQKLVEILDAHGKSHPDILPVLVFANAGVHIETVNPAIRIVLMDGVENLIEGLVKGKEVLQPTEINFLSDSLEIIANSEKVVPVGEEEDFFGRDLLLPEKKAPLKLPEIPLPADLSLPPVEEKLKFTRKQWFILEVLLVLTILVLLGAIIYVLKVL
jgi:Nuclease-related domain